MKISVKISDIEIIIERPNYKEPVSVTQELGVMELTILPTLKEAVKSVTELYNNRFEKLTNDKN